MKRIATLLHSVLNKKSRFPNRSQNSENGGCGERIDPAILNSRVRIPFEKARKKHYSSTFEGTKNPAQNDVCFDVEEEEKNFQF